MAARRTTTCCSAVALIVVSLVLVAASAAVSGTSPAWFKKSAPAPVTLTPTRTAWTLALNAHLVQPPAYDGDRGYFAIEGGRVVAYDVRSGTRRWIIDANPASAMTAGGGSVFFAADSQLVAVDGSDGSMAWTTALHEPLSAPAAWANGWLVVATRDGQIAALRAADGTLVWQQDLGSAAHASPAIVGDRVYVPVENHMVLALQIETGEQIWQRRLGGTPNDILAADDNLFVGASDHYLYCIDTADGQVSWRTRAGSEVAGLPAIDERRVYYVSLDNVLRAVNRSHGVQQWIQMLSLRPIGGPVTAGATVVVAGLQPPVRAFDLIQGKSAGDIAVTGVIAAPVYALPADNQPPALVVVTRDVAGGDSITLVSRTLDPPITPFAGLANPLATVPPLPRGG